MFNTRKKNLKIWILTVLAISLMLFVVACGGSESPPPTAAVSIPTPEEAAATPTPSADDRIKQGIAYHEQGKFEEAVVEYKIAIELEPDNPDTHRNLGTAYLDQGKWEEAAAAYEQAIDLNPNFGEAYGDVVAVYVSLDKVPEAIEAGEKAIELAPNYATAYSNLGVAYQQQNQRDEAVAAFQKAIFIDPDYAMPHYNMGLVHIQQGQSDQALTEWQEAARLDPNYPNTHKNLGLVYFELGQTAESLAEFEIYLQLDPDAPDRAAMEENIAKLTAQISASSEEAAPQTPADDLALYEHDLDCLPYNESLTLKAFSILYSPEFEVSDCRDKPNNYVVFEHNPGTASEVIVFLSKMNVDADADGQFMSTYLVQAKNLLDAQGPQLASQLKVEMVNDQPLTLNDTPLHRMDFMGEVSGATRLVRLVLIPNFETGQGLTFMALKMVEGDLEEGIAEFEALTQEMIASATFPPAPASDAILESALPPESVVQAIFDAANSGDFASLKDLCDPLGENDGDTQMICDLATDETNQEEFVQYFAAGKISGDTQISPDGAQTAVPFLFGPDGDSEETMVLINRDGQWYLFGF